MYMYIHIKLTGLERGGASLDEMVREGSPGLIRAETWRRNLPAEGEPEQRPSCMGLACSRAGKSPVGKWSELMVMTGCNVSQYQRLDS